LKITYIYNSINNTWSGSVSNSADNAYINHVYFVGNVVLSAEYVFGGLNFMPCMRDVTILVTNFCNVTRHFFESLTRCILWNNVFLHSLNFNLKRVHVYW